MNAVTARKMVLVSVLGLLIVATYKGKSGKVATSTRLWGTGWLAIMLGITADFAPGIAGPFALLILAGSLTNGGDQAFTNLLGKAGAGTGSGKPKAPPPGYTNGPPGQHGPVGGNSGNNNGSGNPNSQGPAGVGGPVGGSNQ